MAGHVTEGNFKSSDDQGVLKLGNLSQNYISDPDLRAVLANAELDANKMKDFEDQELLLATSVIYSDKFVLRGKRKRQVLLLSNICCVSIFKNCINKCCSSDLYFLSSHAVSKFSFHHLAWCKIGEKFKLFSSK